MVAGMEDGELAKGSHGGRGGLESNPVGWRDKRLERREGGGEESIFFMFNSQLAITYIL